MYDQQKCPALLLLVEMESHDSFNNQTQLMTRHLASRHSDTYNQQSC